MAHKSQQRSAPYFSFSFLNQRDKDRKSLGRSDRQSISTVLPPSLHASLPPRRLLTVHPPLDARQHMAAAQRSASPSYPSSTAWDSRSSRKTSLPPCQCPLGSLAHSSEAGNTTPPHPTPRPPLSQQNPGSSPNRSEGRRLREGGSRGDAGERVSGPRLLQLSSSLNVTPPPSLLASLIFAMSSSFPVWLRPLLHTRSPAGSTAHRHTQTPPTRLMVSSVHSSLLFFCPRSCHLICKPVKFRRVILGLLCGGKRLCIT